MPETPKGMPVRPPATLLVSVADGDRREPAALRLADAVVHIVERKEDALPRQQQQQIEAQIQRVRHRV